MKKSRRYPTGAWLLPVLLWAGVWIGVAGPEAGSASPREEASPERETAAAPLTGVAIPSTASLRPAHQSDPEAPPSPVGPLASVHPDRTSLLPGRSLGPPRAEPDLPGPSLQDQDPNRTRGPPSRIG